MAESVFQWMITSVQFSMKCTINRFFWLPFADFVGNLLNAGEEKTLSLKGQGNQTLKLKNNP